MANYPVGTQVKFNQSPVKKNITVKSTKAPTPPGAPDSPMMTSTKAKIGALKKVGKAYGLK